MFRVGATFYRDAEYRLSLLDGDVQISVVVGHDARRAPLFRLRLAVLQPLHRLVPPDPAPFFQQRPTFLFHVETPRQLMSQFLWTFTTI